MPLNLKYRLPETVVAIREGWQWTCTSGAVVSGLLAGVAAQLLSTFKGDEMLMKNNRNRNLVLALCYIAIFLNIGATIGSFILTDSLGGIGYKAANGMNGYDQAGQISGVTEAEVLKNYGASEIWNGMLLHWLVIFYFGILSLIISVLAYVWVVEACIVSIFSTISVASVLMPTTYFILIRPFRTSPGE